MVARLPSSKVVSQRREEAPGQPLLFEVLVSELVVAIDGTAGCGKSTVAKKVARRLNCLHLNSGLLYRALANVALERNIDLSCNASRGLSSASQVIALANSLDFQFERTENGGTEFRLNGENCEGRLLPEEIADAASLVALLPEVRQVFFDIQRKAFEREHVIVVEGRDAGTEVFPFAQAKFYLDAAVSVRASRRLAQLSKHGLALAPLEQIVAQIQCRDHRDQTRPIAPQRPAPEAHLLDTARLSATQISRKILSEIEGVGLIFSHF